MPFSYRISHSGDYVGIVGKGRINTRDCVAVIKSVLGDPHCNRNAHALIDLRKAAYEPRDSAEVVHIARTLENFSSRLKSNIAIVGKSSTLFPSEVFALHVRNAAHVGIRVFLDLTAAKNFCRGYSKTA
jgi:hypothetical protein